jgi:hypothetical protein
VTQKNAEPIAARLDTTSGAKDKTRIKATTQDQFTITGRYISSR